MKKIYSKHIVSSLLAMFFFAGCDDAGFLKEEPGDFLYNCKCFFHFRTGRPGCDHLLSTGSQHILSLR